MYGDKIERETMEWGDGVDDRFTDHLAGVLLLAGLTLSEEGNFSLRLSLK